MVGWWVVNKNKPKGAGAGGAKGGPGGPADDLAAMETKDLERLAATSLLETDDAIRDSENELGFAQAQFGDADSKPFAAAIAAAKDDLKGAFQLRQQLDDSTPETADQRRALHAEIVRACRRANARLDEQAARFEEFRAIEKKAPEILAAIPAQIAAVNGRVPSVAAVLSQLQAYDDAIWQPVVSNVPEAGTRIAAAKAAAEEGSRALAAGDGAKAGQAARLAQDALSQATSLLDAVDRLKADVNEAITKVDAMLAEAVGDVARAKVGLETHPNAEAAARLAQAESLLTQAQQELAPPKPNPSAAYQMASQANDLADQQIAVVRSAAEQATRDQARLEASIRSAQAGITRCRRLHRLAARRDRRRRPNPRLGSAAAPRPGGRPRADRCRRCDPGSGSRLVAGEPGIQLRPVGLRQLRRPVAGPARRWRR